MAKIIRFGVSIEKNLLETFDASIARKGYGNRSEAIRDLIRDHLVKEKEEEGNKEMVGTLTIVYNHQTRELLRNLTEMQHRYYQTILSALHIHLDEHYCLEVLVVRGKARDLQKISDRLIGTRGVKHGKLSLTTSGKDLT